MSGAAPSAPLSILHVCSDWKWTGPAEPMLLAIAGLRALGHRVDLACPEPPRAGEPSLAEAARERGIEPVLELDRGRGIHWWRDLDDSVRLGATVAAGGYGVLHAWHSRCHALALRVAGLGSAGRVPRVVRSFPRAGAIPPWPWNRWLFGPGCDGLHLPSAESVRSNASLRAGRPTLGCLGAVSPERFVRGRGGRARRELGIPSTAPVVGIAARVQPHRRFDLLLEALVEARRASPELRLLIVGRGTRLREVARRPAKALGVRDRVVFAGYRTDDYADVLAAMDVFTYVVPGSDGSCRAVLEAQAVGIPAVVSRRGALEEIVLDGRTGRVVDETPAAFARAWLDLTADDRARRDLGDAARDRALGLFTRERLAGDLEGLYREVTAV